MMTEDVKTALGRILIIDDDPMVRESLDLLFSHYGYSVVTLRSGEDLMERLYPLDYDLAIVDHLMEGADGIEVIKHLKSVSTAPVFMLTGCIKPEVRIAAEDAGVDRFFSKPAPAEQIVAALRTL